MSLMPDRFARIRGHRSAAWLGAAAVACALAVLPFLLSSVGTAWVRITNLAILFAILLGYRAVVWIMGRKSVVPVRANDARELA